MKRLLLPVIAGALGIALTAAVLPSASAQDSAKPDSSSTTTSGAWGYGVVSQPVSFTVSNVNTSKLTCGTDGGTYTIRGNIVGPQGKIIDAKTATLYLHGLDLGEFFWTGEFQGDSFAERQAEAGHVSVVIDRLGYDSSGKPNGFQSCFGGQADIAHQIVQQLKKGSYQVRRGEVQALSFDKVVLAGHSVGGSITELEAYSFGDVDGIIVASHDDTGFTDAATAAAAAATKDCQAGGTPTEGSAPDGYAFFSSSPENFRQIFFVSTPPALIDAALELRNLNPCGDMASAVPAQQLNFANVSKISVPVLVIAGKEDEVYPRPLQAQADLFTGSTDVKVVGLSPSGHSLTTEQTAPQFANAVSHWLDSQDLGD